MSDDTTTAAKRIRGKAKSDTPSDPAPNPIQDAAAQPEPAPDQPMDGREANPAFIITTDEPFLAGQRNPGKGKTIAMSEEAARYLLISGEIERVKD